MRKGREGTFPRAQRATKFHYGDTENTETAATIPLCVLRASVV
jgi:hypothetical protein